MRQQGRVRKAVYAGQTGHVPGTPCHNLELVSQRPETKTGWLMSGDFRKQRKYLGKLPKPSGHGAMPVEGDSFPSGTPKPS